MYKSNVSNNSSLFYFILHVYAPTTWTRHSRGVICNGWSLIISYNCMNCNSGENTWKTEGSKEYALKVKGRRIIKVFLKQGVGTHPERSLVLLWQGRISFLNQIELFYFQWDPARDFREPGESRWKRSGSREHGVKNAREPGACKLKINCQKLSPLRKQSNCFIWNNAIVSNKKDWTVSTSATVSLVPGSSPWSPWPGKLFHMKQKTLTETACLFHHTQQIIFSVWKQKNNRILGSIQILTREQPTTIWGARSKGKEYVSLLIGLHKNNGLVFYVVINFIFFWSL